MSETTSTGFAIPLPSDWSYKEFKEFYGLMAGEAQSISYEDFISPVFIMNAIARSLESGKEEFVRSFEI